jgi:hypothetical protein
LKAAIDADIKRLLGPAEQDALMSRPMYLQMFAF